MRGAGRRPRPLPFPGEAPGLRRGGGAHRISSGHLAPGLRRGPRPVHFLGEAPGLRRSGGAHRISSGFWRGAWPQALAAGRGRSISLERRLASGAAVEPTASPSDSGEAPGLRRGGGAHRISSLPHTRASGSYSRMGWKLKGCRKSWMMLSGWVWRATRGGWVSVPRKTVTRV